ncbi:MAG: hypothetical protein U0574_11535 [Phycisphaerales bacterium]
MKRPLLLLAAALAACALAWGLRMAVVPEASGTLDASRMAPERGAAWSAPLQPSVPWWIRVPNDGAGISSLVLTEDGRPLGPAHAPPDLVRSQGGGAFNHWGEVLFSSADGSNPATNGRTYAWRAATEVHPRIQLALLLCVILSACAAASAWFRERPGDRAAAWVALVGLLAISWNVESLRLYPSWINVDWDTASYLGWSPERTAGYPAFLWLAGGGGGQLRWLLAVQLNLQLASFALLGLAVDRALRTRVAGLALMVLLATSPRLMAFPFSVLTESLFVSLLCMMLAACCMAARRDAPRGAVLAWLAVAGALLGALELVRPAGTALLAMGLLPLLWLPGARLRGAAALLLPWAALLAVASGVNWARFGFFKTSAMGPVTLLGQVGWNIRPETNPSQPELAARVQARLAPVLARRPARLEWPRDYYFWTSDEYNELLWANIMPETQAWVEANGPADDRGRRQALERVRGTMARETLLADVPAFARHAAAHVWGFWQSAARPASLGPALKGRVPRGAESVRNLWDAPRREKFAWIGPAPALEAPSALDRLTWMEWWRTPLDSNPSILWKVVAVVTLVGVAMAPWSRRWSGAGRLLCLSGVGFQASAVLVAAVTAVIARYVDAVEPLSVTALVAAVRCVMEAVERRRA